MPNDKHMVVSCVSELLGTYIHAFVHAYMATYIHTYVSVPFYSLPFYRTATKPALGAGCEPKCTQGRMLHAMCLP